MVATEESDLEFISDSELSEILGKIPDIEAWIKAVRAEAERRLQAGEHVPGYKLVHGRSYRRWDDEQAVAAELLSLGWREEDIFESKLISVAQLEKTLGRDMLQDIFDSYIIKPPGKPTIVPQDDSRQPITKYTAQDDFK